MVPLTKTSVDLDGKGMFQFRSEQLRTGEVERPSQSESRRVQLLESGHGYAVVSSWPHR